MKLNHLTFALALTLAAASSLTVKVPAHAGTQSLNPAPIDPASISSQLQRFRGQTRFLNPSPYARLTRSSGSPAGMEKSGGGARAIQESDVFKVGKPGSKLLYLLNQARGLQVVSFVDGTANPKLLGRVAPTGNYPDDMYIDFAHDRLLVLERLWYDTSGNWSYSQQQSRILVYDIRNPAEPKLAQTLPVDGEIADSRLVGDVLYIASSVRPHYSTQGSREKPRGKVSSFRIDGESVAAVESKPLALPASSRENMNILETTEGGAPHYYLVAVLSESGWGWWDRQSLVEVIDISDPHGRIAPLMVASARGFITERSQTFIKNRTLIVASNYTPQSPERAPMRISLETFRLPEPSSELISEDEALYRKLAIERRLARMPADGKSDLNAQKDDLQARLLSDAELGLRGRFVVSTDGKLRKPIPDSAVTVGDTQGQSASLRDVRYDGNLAYVFWVPQNQVDPFDLFDISEPEKGVRYIKRLQFDGWIERAIPMTWEGRQFVLGLGWVIENVNNDRGRRKPQAMLFEVSEQGGAPRAIEVAQLSFASSSIWTDFSSGDKYVEVRSRGDGTGMILFGAYAWENGKSVSGGKLIGFDLRAAVAGRASEVFQEGALLGGNSGWLRRVFSNPEIDAINTFTDLALGTYPVSQVGSATQIARAVSVLELARDIVAYFPMGVRGVQIINPYSWWESGNASVKLRVVDGGHADAEAPQRLSETSIEGSYVDALIERETGKLLIATQINRSAYANDRWVSDVTYVFTRLALGPDAANAQGSGLSLVVESRVEWKNPNLPAANAWQRHSSGTKLIEFPSGQLLAQLDAQLIELKPAGGKSLQARAMTVSGCDAMGTDPRGGSTELLMLNGVAYALFNEIIEDPAYESITLERHWLAPLTIDSDRAACGPAVNIPGRPLSLTPSGKLLVQDEKFVALQTRNRPGRAWTNVVTAASLGSLRISWTATGLVALPVATLEDDYELGTRRAEVLRAFAPGRVVLLRQRDGEERSELVHLALDADDRFTRETFLLEDGLPAHSRILALLETPNVPGGWLALAGNGRQTQVLRFTLANRAPVPVKLSLVGVNGRREEALETVTLPGWFSDWRYWNQPSRTSVAYDPGRGALVLPLGISGAAQLYLVE